MGETLAPETLGCLARLGLLEALGGLARVESPGIVALWSTRVPVEIDYLGSPWGCGWHVDRAAFHGALQRVVQAAGGIVCRARPRACRLAALGEWIVVASDGAQSREYAARWIIDATGRSRWFVARRGVRRRVFDRLTAVVFRHGPHGLADHRLHVEAGPDGWWYSCPLPGNRACTVFLTDGDLVPRPMASSWRKAWDRDALIVRRFGGLRTVEDVRVVPAPFQCSDLACGSGWFAAGEAAVGTDPLSGHGIHDAIEGGWRAARSLLSEDCGGMRRAADYQEWIDSSRRQRLIERHRYYGLVTRWAEHPFWKRRRDAHQASWDNEVSHAPTQTPALQPSEL
jgi:flavin-dependent dehydrogenase